MWWSFTHPHFVFLQDAENDPQRQTVGREARDMRERRDVDRLDSHLV